MALKLRYPRKVFLLRGNHEDVNQTVNYGFYEECMQRWGDKEGFEVSSHTTREDAVLATLHRHLQLSPRGGSRLLSRGRRILCMHGGLSPFVGSLEQIDGLVQRPSIIPAFGPFTDLFRPEQRVAVVARERRQRRKKPQAAASPPSLSRMNPNTSLSH